MSKKEKEIIKGFHFDDATHTYTFDGKKMTGVTSMLNKTLAKPALIPWAAKMVTDYIKENCKDGDGYFCTEMELDEARVAHTTIRDKAGDTGKDVHAAIEDYVKLMIQDQAGRPLNINDNENKHLEAFISWAQKNDITFLQSEAVFYSRDLFLAGTADLVFETRDGVRCFGDVKIKKKIYGREPFLQMAAYHLLSESMGNPKAERSVVLRIDPISAEIEELWSLNVPADRGAFMAVLDVYRYMNN